MQIVFQDPHASLNPAMTIEQSVGHPLKIHKLASGDGVPTARGRRRSRPSGLAPAEQFMDKYPSDLSGGQKQRAVIARAIIMNPLLLVADEPVSMLDMSVRAKILELMLDLKRELGLTYLYITHDLATAKFFCDRIAILYLGRIVEIGPSEAIYEDPKHPYTKALLRAIPEPDPRRSVPRDLPRGEVPDAARPPLGCSFHPRCPAGVRGLRLGVSRPRRLSSRPAGRYSRSRSTRPSRRVDSRTSTRSSEPSIEIDLRGSEWQRGADVMMLLESVRGETIRRSRSGVACDGSSRRTNSVDIRWHDPVEPRQIDGRRRQGRVPPLRRRGARRGGSPSGRRRRRGPGNRARLAGSVASETRRRRSGGEACEIPQRLEALERLALELTHALAREVELVPDRLERPRLALEPEAKLEDAALALRERVERPPDALAPEGLFGLVEGSAASRSANRSPSSPSSSAPTVWFSETDACAAPSASSTCCSGRPVASASSSFVASRPSSTSSRRAARESFCWRSTTCTGTRIVRAWFATARCTDWRIHQVA